jgi:hypothetical protein
MIRPKAEPKSTAVPARLPKIGCSFNQKGSATSRPTIGGTVAPSPIQYQFSSFTSEKLYTKKPGTRVRRFPAPKA